MRSYGLEYAQTLSAAYEFADRLENYIDHHEHIPQALIAVGIARWSKDVSDQDIADFLRGVIEEIENQRAIGNQFCDPRVVELYEPLPF